MTSSGRRTAQIAAVGAYLVLALTPLLLSLAPPSATGRSFWIELSIALGFIGMAQMGLQFALIARFQKLSRPFGIDLVMQYHRQIGILTLLVVVAHPVILIAMRPAWMQLLNPFGGNAASRTGVLAIVALLLLIITSLWRRPLKLGYEVWRTLHALLAIAALGLTYAHIALIGVYANTRWKLTLLAIWCLAFIALIVFLRLIKPAVLRRRRWEVVEVLAEAPTTWSLVLSPVGHEGLRFAPGQFGWLKIGVSPWSLDEHPFSFSSSAEEPQRLELGIKELGDFTNRIGELRPGTPAFIDGPHGSFSIDFEPAASYLFITGGIGISPILSMLRTLAHRADERSHTLVYACSRWDRTAFRDEIESLQHRMNLRVVYVLEEGHEGWRGATGFVSRELLAPLVREDGTDQHVFICGPDPMMTAVERALNECGVPNGRIHMERFNLV